MSAILYPGIGSVQLIVDPPVDPETGESRDDLSGIKVWCSTVSGFTPDTNNLKYDGPGLNITIPNLTDGIAYYVKYALISAIDSSEYTISSQLSAAPESPDAAVTGYLTSESATVSAGNDGTVASYNDLGGSFKVFQGAVDQTANATFSVVPGGTITASITSAGIYTISGMMGDSGSVTFRATYRTAIIDKTYTLSKSKTGVDGAEGLSYNVEIESTNGDVFKPGQSTSTTLIAHVFLNGVEVTDQISSSRFRWRRVSYVDQPWPGDDETWNGAHATGFKSINLTLTEVSQRATFHCDIIDS